MQQASTFIIGTYSHTITLLIQTYSLSIFQIDLPLQLFNQLFERFERRKAYPSLLHKSTPSTAKMDVTNDPFTYHNRYIRCSVRKIVGVTIQQGCRTR